jgi:O-antigen/teichoic acid export membrane protein
MSFLGRIKKLASETAIYGLSSIVGRMIGYLLVPIYTQVFEPDRYGIVTIVYAAFIVLNILYTYGLEGAYLRFASGSKGRPQANDVFSTATWMLLGTSVIFSGIFLALRDPIGVQLLQLPEMWTYLLYYAAGIVVLDTLAIVPMAELRLQNRPWRFAGIRLANILTNVGLNLIFLLVLGWGIEAVLLANLIASAVMLLLLAPVYLERFRPRFERPLMREMLRFGLPILPGGIGYAITEIINRIYLTRMDGARVLELYGDSIDRAALEAKAAEAAAAAGDQQAAIEAFDNVFGTYVVGVYSAALKLGVFMMLVAQMFKFAWQPFFLQHSEDPDAKPLFSRVFTVFTAIGLAAFLGVSFFAQELVSLPLPGGRYLIEPSYWLGLSVVPLILLAYFFEGWYYVFTAGAYIEKKTVYFIYCTGLGALVTITMNVTLVPIYGMVAAAWSMVAGYLAMAVMLALLTQRIYPLPLQWGRVLSMLALAGGIFGAWYFVDMLQVWYIELALLIGFVGGLVGLRIVPLHILRQITRRS